MMDIRAIIPVAGVGSRLRPHTYSAPKVLLQVAGKPILGHILDELRILGIRRLTFIVGYRGEMIRDYVESLGFFETTYILQEKPQGLGQAIHLTRESGLGEKRLLIVLGDTVFRADLRNVLASPCSLIGVKAVEDPSRFGIVETDGDIITGMEEKPEKAKSNLAIVGLYYLTEPARLYESLERLIALGKTTKEEYQLTDALEMMIQEGVTMRPFMVEGWYDCGKPETLLHTNRELLQQLKPHPSLDTQSRAPGCIINSPVSIAEGAKLENSIIGPYVTVAAGAVIRHAIVRNSIISRNAHVANISLDQSIVSDNARVESHHYCLNIGDSSEMKVG